MTNLDGAYVEYTAKITPPEGDPVTVPVTGGNVVWQSDQQPNSQCARVQIPHRLWGRNLIETGEVGVYGHKIELNINVRTASGTRSKSLGRYRITKIKQEETHAEIDGLSLESAIFDHKAPAPTPISKNATIRQAVEHMLKEDGVSAEIDGGHDGVKLPDDTTIGTDRGQSFKDLIQAWGAYVAPSEHADITIGFTPVEIHDYEPMLRLTDSQDGTIVGADINLDRNLIFNHVVVDIKNNESKGEAIQRSGGLSVELFGWRTKTINGENIENEAQAVNVAHAELAKSIRRAVTIPVEIIPNLDISPHGIVAVEAKGKTRIGRVTGYEFPLKAGETMVIDVGTEGE